MFTLVDPCNLMCTYFSDFSKTTIYTLISEKNVLLVEENMKTLENIH